MAARIAPTVRGYAAIASDRPLLVFAFGRWVACAPNQRAKLIAYRGRRLAEYERLAPAERAREERTDRMASLEYGVV